MTNDELEQILSAGTIDERIAELLREQIKAEGEVDASRDQPGFYSAGRLVVPNIAGPIAGIFQRGRANAKIKEAKQARDLATRQRDAAAKVMAEGALGRNLEPIQPTTPRIGTPPAVDTAAQDAILAQPGPKPAPAPSAPPAPPPAAPQAPAAAPAPVAAAAPPSNDLPNGPIDPEVLIKLLLGGKKKGLLPGEDQAPLYPGSAY